MPRRTQRSPHRSPSGLARGLWLLLVDNRPLQAAAWQELLRLRQRMEKIARDVHRHEQKDEPAFRAWLGESFPTLISATRSLLMEIEAKRQLIEKIEMEAFATGRSPSSVWHGWQRAKRNGEDDEDLFDEDFDEETGRFEGRDPWDGSADGDERSRRRRRPFDDAGESETDDERDRRRASERERIIDGMRRNEAPEQQQARDLYRRLVQQLHPDRGGAWTPVRERVWHQVQRAWEARDLDWLSRLEAEWESATDVLHPGSPLGRLQAACREAYAARRDAERKLRAYRKTDAWRFTLTRRTESYCERLRSSIENDCHRLRATLREAQAILDAWQRPRKRRREHPWRSATSHPFY